MPRSVEDVVLAENRDGSRVIYAIGHGALMAQRPDGTILNDDAGVPKLFGSRTQAEAWLSSDRTTSSSSDRRSSGSSSEIIRSDLVAAAQGSKVPTIDIPPSR